MGAEVIVVVGAAGALVVVGVVVSVASSSWEEQAERATMSESPRRWMGFMLRSRRGQLSPSESATR